VEQHPNARRSLFRRWPLVLVGVALLVVSVVGAKQALRSPSDPSAPPPGAAAAENRAVGGGHVDTEDGVVRPYPAQPGRVKTVFVQANDDVDKDAPLFAMDSALADDQLLEAKAAAKEARAALEEAKLAILGARQLEKQHEDQKAAQAEAIKARLAELNAARAKNDEVQRQARSGVAKAEQARQAEEAVKALEAIWEAEKAKLRSVEALDPKLAIQQAEAKKKRAEAALERAEAAVRKAELAVKECVVRAPAKGKVLRVLVKPGDVLGPNPQVPALEFVADAPRIVRVEIEQEWANRLRPDMTAKIQDETRAGKVWEGKLKRISDWYTHRRSQLFEPLQYNDVRTVECIVEFNDTRPDVKIGQRMRVTLE
jgi:multidrug resistance efflux pump